jgi:hypothetical protein
MGNHQKAVQALPRFRMFHRNRPLQLTVFPFAATMETPLWTAAMGTFVIWSLNQLVRVALKLEKWLDN